MGLKENTKVGMMLLTTLLIIIGIIIGLTKIIDYSNEMDNKRDQFLASMNECDRIQYKIDNINLIKAKTMLIEEQRNIILMGKCGGININTR